MSTQVAVNTHSHSVTYVTDKLLGSVKEIVRLSGLDPDKLSDDWQVLELGILTWLNDEHLEVVHLEVYHATTNKLVGRWDFDIFYNYSSGDGSFWQDPDDIKYHIRKQNLDPANCNYRVVTTTTPGRRDVSGWSGTSLRSTDGFVRQGIGTTINGSGLSAGAGYWRKK